MRRFSEKTTLRAVQILPVLMAFVVFVSPTAKANTRESVKVNVSSFAAAGISGDPLRTIALAASQWTWAASSETYFEVDGTTTSAGCGIGTPNHIYVQPGCAEAACTTGASYYNCPFGGWRIRLWAGVVGGWSLAPSSVSVNDVQVAVSHELGHRITVHEDSEICVMNSVSSLSVRERAFCGSEIDNLDGRHADLPLKFASSTSYPLPGGSWSTSNVNPAGTIGGFGFVDVWRGSLAGALFDMVVTSNHMGTPAGRQIVVSSYPNVSGSLLPQFPTRMRPTVAFDRTRQRWWLFWRVQPWDSVMYATSSDAVNWTYGGSVAASPSSYIQSRVPVAAAYEPYSDRMVVVFSNFHGNCLSPTPGTCSGMVNGQLGYTSIPAGTPGVAWPAATPLNGAITFLPPVVACEASNWQTNCEVGLVGVDASRAIRHFGFGLNTNGSLFMMTSITTSDGLTDFPMGITDNGAGLSGAFVLAHRGGDSRIYLKQKKWAQDAWPSFWTGTNLTTGPAGTPVGIRESTANYHVFLTPVW